jgi:hypothetical protein
MLTEKAADFLSPVAEENAMSSPESTYATKSN